MPLSFASREVMQLDGETIFSVQSSRCPYKVVVGQGEVHLSGPGVSETFPITEELEGLSEEGQALIAVIMFEEMERG